MSNNQKVILAMVLLLWWMWPKEEVTSSWKVIPPGPDGVPES